MSHGENKNQENLLRQRLLGQPSKVLIMTIAAEAVSDDDVFDALCSFIYSDEEPLRRRAAWVVEKVSVLCPSVVSSQRKKLMHLCMMNNLPNGVRRLLLSILYNLFEKDMLDVEFLNFLLEKMCDMKSTPGVQALAMKLAFQMCRVEPDLREEFFNIIYYKMELDSYSAGVRSVVYNCMKNRK